VSAGVTLRRRMAARDTPATTAARKAGVEHRVLEYEHDPAAASYGMEAAEALGLDPARVFKTLVVDRDGTLTVCIVPVAAELDLRALGKRARMADTTKAERTTGYVAGGISPLGQRRALPTLVDETALEHDTVFVSAGRRGLEIELAPGDLVALTRAEVRPLRR
jgi:Cys-tRNA(Pro)/Cys-tRNA(Cys) deacylase